MTPPAWNPRWDRSFRSTWLNHLVTHRGEWFHPTDLWSTDDEWQRSLLRVAAYEAVVAARRLGYVIDGDRRHGYYYRYSELPRYVIYTRVAGRNGTPTGQLSLFEITR